MYQIVEQTQESPGRWCVRVIVSADEAMFLWFDVEPTQQAVDAAIDAQLTQRALAAPVVEVVVLKCSPRQMRRALNALGLRDAVEAAVAASGDDNIKDDWEYATEFLRFDPLVVGMGAALGKTDAEMDALFELARGL